jgi:L,D-peptidoglycan transpeptidase YkuD (ErfK/YbiS/YcfS/YnhG family)
MPDGDGLSPMTEAPLIRVEAPGRFHLGGVVFPCALGRTGILADKVEGDGGTPVGRFPLRMVYYRPDREAPPETALPISALTPDMGWCDDPADPAYNRPVALPFSASHERLWRDDALYDLIVILGHNDDPVVPGLGSAVFLHVAPPEGKPTQGCVALSKAHLRQVLTQVGPNTILEVVAPSP